MPQVLQDHWVKDPPVHLVLPEKVVLQVHWGKVDPSGQVVVGSVVYFVSYF